MSKYIESINKFKGIDWGAYVSQTNYLRKNEEDIPDSHSKEGAEYSSDDECCSDSDDYGGEGEDDDKKS